MQPLHLGTVPTLHYRKISLVISSHKICTKYKMENLSSVKNLNPTSLCFKIIYYFKNCTFTFYPSKIGISPDFLFFYNLVQVYIVASGLATLSRFWNSWSRLHITWSLLAWICVPVVQLNKHLKVAFSFTHQYININNCRLSTLAETWVKLNWCSTASLSFRSVHRQIHAPNGHRTTK